MKLTKSRLKEMIREEIQKLNEGSFKRGYWVILSGRGGELTRNFTEKKSGIKNLIIDLAREGQIDAGDTISIEKGKTEK